MTLRVVAALSTLLLATAVHAQSKPDAATAEALFLEGRSAMVAGDFARACPKLEESLRLQPAVGTKLNLALCEEKLGKVASAWELFHELEEHLTKDDDRRVIVTEHLRAVDARVPRLRIVLSTPATVVIRRDDVELSSASFDTDLPVDPGKHRVSMTWSEGAPETVDVSLSEGERRTLVLVPHAPPAPSVAAPVVAAPVSSSPPPMDTCSVPAPAPAPPPSNERSMVPVYVAGSVGVAGLAIGAFAGIEALRKSSVAHAHCDASGACDDTGFAAASQVHGLSTASTVGWLVGGVGLGAAAAWLFWPHAETHPEVSLGVGPAAISISSETRF